MRRVLTACVVIGGLSLLAAACSPSAEDLLKDGDTAMRSLARSTGIDTAVVNKGIASEKMLLTRFPDDSRADSATFVLAALLDVMSRRQEAADTYLAIVNNYPTSRFRPKGLVLAGHLLEGMRDYRRARACYERLIREYPNDDFVTGGSARWLLDYMELPPEKWSVPFQADSVRAGSSGTSQPPT